MKFFNKLYSPLMAMVLAALACENPLNAASAPVDLNSLNTLVAQTVAAAKTQSIMPGSPLPGSPQMGETASFTFTPESPTLMPSSTFTPTPSIAPTPLVPLIRVSVATNCRSGPGKVYDYWGALLVGVTTEVIARDTSGNYWYIRNPDSDGNFCWVWGEYATVIGDIADLPVLTPPPTPTPTFTPLPTYTSTPAPSFKVTLSNLETCAASWWVDLKLKNTGAVAFKSYNLSVKDRVTDVTLTDLADGFTDIDGCLHTSVRDVISPGETYLLSAPPFASNLAGHELRVTLTLCSGSGQTGQCVTNKFRITP